MSHDLLDQKQNSEFHTNTYVTVLILVPLHIKYITPSFLLKECTHNFCSTRALSNFYKLSKWLRVSIHI